MASYGEIRTRAGGSSPRPRSAFPPLGSVVVAILQKWNVRSMKHTISTRKRDQRWLKDPAVAANPEKSAGWSDGGGGGL